MRKKSWEETSSINEYEWKAKVVRTDRNLLESIWETYTYKDNFGNEITEHHCLPRPSKQLIEDIKKLEEKYKKKQKYFLDKSIKLLNNKLKGI